MAEPLVATSGFDRLLKDRIIWLGAEVRDDNANEICAKILLLAAEAPEKDIFLYVNSPGGSITAGMAIYDTMTPGSLVGDHTSTNTARVRMNSAWVLW